MRIDMYDAKTFFTVVLSIGVVLFLALLALLIVATVADAHKVDGVYHTGWERGKPQLYGTGTWYHKHPNGIRWNYVIRNFHSEYHGGGDGHARSGEPFGWHYSCVFDDNGNAHHHPLDQLTDEQIHKQTNRRTDGKYEMGGTGTPGEDCLPEYSRTHDLFVTHSHHDSDGDTTHHIEESIGDTTHHIEESIGDTTHHIEESIGDRIGDCSDELAEGEVEFIMPLKRGYNRVSIPLLNPSIGCVEIEHLSDFMTAIDSHASYAYGVNDDRFYYNVGHTAGYDPDYQACGRCDENDHVRDREITPEYGWNLVMERDIEIVIRGTPITEYEMTILNGRRNYGIPVKDERLETVTDLFTLFSNVTSFDYYNADGEKQYVYKNTKSDDVFIGGTSYFVNANSDLTVTLSGEAWTELVPTAPPAPRFRQPTLTTTWGEMKR